MANGKARRCPAPPGSTYDVPIMAKALDYRVLLEVSVHTPSRQAGAACNYELYERQS